MENRKLNERDLEQVVGGTDDYVRKDHYENIILGCPPHENGLKLDEGHHVEYTAGLNDWTADLQEPHDAGTYKVKITVNP